MALNAPRSSTLKLASYNIRKAVGLDRKRDPDRILATIRDMAPDVMALQESDLRIGTRHAVLKPADIEARTNLKAVPLDEAGISLGWHGNALLVAKNIKIESVVKWDLPSLEPRGAVSVEMSCGDARLRVIAVHLALIRFVRKRQLRLTAKRIRAMEDLPTIIVGDFNEWSHSKGLGSLSYDYELHAPGKSFHAAWPIASLDRFATNRRVRMTSCGVYQGETALRASDHLPIWANLELLPTAFHDISETDL